MTAAPQGAGAGFHAEDPAQLAQLQQLIHEEWPQVPLEAIQQAGGDLDRLTEVIAENTDHTRALIRLQLAELVMVYQRLREMEAAGVHRAPPPGAGAPPGGFGVPGGIPPEAGQPQDEDPATAQVEGLLGQVEEYLWELARTIPRDMARTGARTAKRHMAVSLSIAAALGFLFGMFAGSGVKADDDS